jgi:predicted AAA+ superfamily ATPase
MSYLHRKLEIPLQSALKQFPVVLITGPRQAGKSTLLKHCLQGYRYVTFDDLLIRELAQRDPELFLQTYRPPIIFDEIQYVPSLLSYIKIQVDAQRREYGQYVLTGSQIFSLMKGVSESLAGRVAVFHLYPLSWEEMFSKHLKQPIDIFHQMLKGFYPEFYVQKDLNPKFWHSSYLSTYLEKDLRAIRNIQDLGQFQRFLVLIAARAGQLFNLQEIGKECGISQTTAKDWIMLLQATSIIYLLEPFAKNLTKRIIKSPKLLFVDTGLLCYLLRLETVEQLMHSPFASHIFENMVIMEKIKSYANKGERAPCYFYRTSHGEEIDLLVDLGDSVETYEIKFTASPSAEMALELLRFQKEFSVKKSAVLTLRQESIPLKKDVFSKHWSEIIDS